MVHAVFKTLEFIVGWFSWKTGRRIGAALFAGWAGLSACGVRPGVQTITVQALEDAPTARPRFVRRAIVSPAAEWQSCYYALGPRLGLVQIRSEHDWENLRTAAPEIGPCPDFNQGIVVGLVSHAGLPVNGRWPIHLDTIRICRGAGFATGEFEGGTYLPDGTTYLEVAQFSELRSVLMVEIDGTRFYPGEEAK